jgi:hypothetical protein
LIEIMSAGFHARGPPPIFLGPANNVGDRSDAAPGIRVEPFDIPPDRRREKKTTTRSGGI